MSDLDCSVEAIAAATEELRRQRLQRQWAAQRTTTVGPERRVTLALVVDLASRRRAVQLPA